MVFKEKDYESDTYRWYFAHTDNARGTTGWISLVLYEHFGDVDTQNSAHVDEHYATHYDVEHHVIVCVHWSGDKRHQHANCHNEVVNANQKPLWIFCFLTKIPRLVYHINSPYQYRTLSFVRSSITTDIKILLTVNTSSTMTHVWIILDWHWYFP